MTRVQGVMAFLAAEVVALSAGTGASGQETAGAIAGEMENPPPLAKPGCACAAAWHFLQPSQLSVPNWALNVFGGLAVPDHRWKRREPEFGFEFRTWRLLLSSGLYLDRACDSAYIPNVCDRSRSDELPLHRGGTLLEWNAGGTLAEAWGVVVVMWAGISFAADLSSGYRGYQASTELRWGPLGVYGEIRRLRVESWPSVSYLNYPVIGARYSISIYRNLDRRMRFRGGFWDWVP